MESLRTLLRIVVMLAALVIAYKGWQHYGPPAEQLKSFVMRALEVAKSALDTTDQSGTGTSSLAADPRPLAPPLGAPTPAPAPVGQVVQAQALVPASELSMAAPFTPPALAPAPSRLPTPDSPSATSPVNLSPPGPNAELQALYSRLEQLGAHDPQLAAWGSSGQLHRFCCEATLAGAANFNRHFEAVAADPQQAVEEVVAKVEAWRAAQRETAQLGTALR